MKTHSVRIRGIAVLIAVLSCLMVSGAEAQREGARIRKVTALPVKTPEYTTRTGYQPRTRDWLQIVVDYDLQADWTDEAEFKFYVLLKGRDPKADPYTLLTGGIAYVHIQKDRKLQAVMYVHPSIMARYGSFEAMAVEMKIGGRTVALDGTGPWQPWTKWVEQLTAKTDMVMPPTRTPFAVLAADDYEMIKPESR